MTKTENSLKSICTECNAGKKEAFKVYLFMYLFILNHQTSRFERLITK